MAFLISERATCDRGHVGCVAVDISNRIICMGYNGAPKGFPHCGSQCDKRKPCNQAIHAEANLIAYAACNGIALKDTTLYITHGPCKSCAELIIQAGIKKVFYKIPYRNSEGLEKLMKFGIRANLIEDKIPDLIINKGE